jgi:ComF family protein
VAAYRALVGLLDLVLPRRCAVCRLVATGLCDRCRRDLVLLVPPLCACCGSPGAWPVRRCAECAGRRLAFSSARAAIVYEERARALVRAWKERGRRDLAAVAAELVAEVLPRPRADALAFVPGERDRVLERGHAPPEQLARELGRRWELPVGGFLSRTRPVRPQRGLPLAERRRNVAGAFSCDGPAPERVVVVDDVYTTGSTAGACAAALRRAGARRVDVVCLARAVR